MIGVEFFTPRARKDAEYLLEQGIIVNPIGDSIIRFVPSLIMDKNQILYLLEALKKLFIGDNE